MKRNDFWVLIIFFSVIVIVNGILLYRGHLVWGWEGFGIMVGAGLTIAMYSFLYKDNPLFKMAEHFYVGVSGAYIIVQTWFNVLRPDVFQKFGQEYGKGITLDAGGVQWPVILAMVSIVIPSILGLMLYTRLNRKTAWISRFPFAFMIGFGAGYGIPLVIEANILKQLKPTMVPLWDINASAWYLVPQYGAIVIFVGLISTLIYFFYSVEHKGIIGWISKVGIIYLMVAFGASFGFTVMARMSLLIGRIQFLFKDWIPMITS
ncbi:hypothetical protein ACFL54_02610 [Planctomycetota bacterium]